MVQTMSSMHKQNFDLKLELFHRRARQNVLEETIETLEAEKNQAQEENTTLLNELERRDKAVEEAVGMIVSLEARVELLLREREMVRQVESNNAFYTQVNAMASRKDADTPKPRDVLQALNKRNLARMPSFLSERTENTENLRNVYLGAQGSILSLCKAGEDARDPRGDNNGFTSPSMSVLSESSFLSVYGQKVTPHKSSPPDADETARRLGTNGLKTPKSSHGQRSTSGPSRNFTPTSSNRSASRSSRNDAQGAIEARSFTSPLQRLEKLELPVNATNDASQTNTTGQDLERPMTARPLKQHPLPRTKQEKRDALYKVITDAPNQLHVLPPTPDTVSSSVLNRDRSSDETTSRQQRKADEAQFLEASAPDSERSNVGESSDWRQLDMSPIPQAPSVTAFTGRKECSSGNLFDNMLSIPQRPRSADETTISRNKSNWESDSDPDDAASNVSSYDPWIREGLDSGHHVRPHHGASISQRNVRRASPDLFSFPSGTKGWQDSDMFGSLGGNGYLGARAPLAPELDMLGESLPTPESGLFGSGLAGPAGSHGTAAPPPPPGRRSSLNARTSSSTPGTPATRTSPTRKKTQATVSPEKHKPQPLTSREQASSAGRAPSVSSRQTPSHAHDRKLHTSSVPPKQRHYPPVASHQAPIPPRSRGIGSLFRRSLGSSPATTATPSAPTPAEPPSVMKGPAHTVGFPTWERRADIRGDEGSSATPPPIMRSKGSGRGDMDDSEDEMSGAVLNGGHKPKPAPATMPGGSGHGLGSGLNRVMAHHDGGAPLTPLGRAQDTTPAASGSHGKKTWFGLGRRTSGA